MFFGAVPTDCIQQVFKIMDIESWNDAYVCCSGSFRLERALSQVYPNLGIHSNDVSVYSAVIGGLATGQPVHVDFVEKLAFVQELVEGKSDIERAAAVLVACEMSRFARGKNEFNRRHFRHYCDHFVSFMESTAARVEKSLDTMRVSSYFGGDWRKHAHTAVDNGAGILAFPPFFKGDYEAQFKFVDDNLKWTPPAYDLYDPTDLHQIAADLDERGATYCILTDQIWEDKDPVLKYVAGRKVPHFCYANTPNSSYRHKSSKAQSFRYTPVDPDKLTEDSVVQIVQGDSGKLNFIKDVYLATSIVHSSGFGNYLVYIDGMLVGAIIYDESPTTRSAYGARTLYLLSDVTVTGKGKMSKLVAMIAKSRELVHPLEIKMLKRYDRIVTTARSKHPVSMKYRGIYQKMSRRKDEEAGGFVIQYGADLSEQSPQDIYRDWWKKYGPGAQQAPNRNQKSPAKAAAAP
jgi:DNA adenine methylase-like protein/GNAT domain-containint protein